MQNFLSLWLNAEAQITQGHALYKLYTILIGKFEIQYEMFYALVFVIFTSRKRCKKNPSTGRVVAVVNLPACYWLNSDGLIRGNNKSTISNQETTG